MGVSVTVMLDAVVKVTAVRILTKLDVFVSGNVYLNTHSMMHSLITASNCNEAGINLTCVPTVSSPSICRVNKSNGEHCYCGANCEFSGTMGNCCPDAAPTISPGTYNQICADMGERVGG